MLLPPLRRAIAGTLWPVIEWLWTVGFAVAGRLYRPRTRPWYPVHDGTVLAISAHPDDETIGCGGALLRHRQGNDRVVVVQVTDGSDSRAGGLGPEEMAARRACEAMAAANRLDVELDLLALPEHRWEPATLAEYLCERLVVLNPDVVYAPSPVDYHPEHLKVARVLAAALDRPDRPVVRVYEVQVPLTPRLVNLVAEVGTVEARRRETLAAYETQAEPVRICARLHRYNRAFWAKPVECFWQLTPAQYHAIVAAGDCSSSARNLCSSAFHGRASSPYRGLHPRPIGDPLSYLRGWSERRRLVRIAALTQGSASDG